MIRLSGDSVLLRDAAGEVRAADLTALRADVCDALALSGRSDEAVTDDLMRVVRHFAATAVRSGRVLDDDDVRGLVARALRDAGFGDAASVLLGQSAAVALAEDLVPAETSALAAVLAEDARLVGLNRTALAAAVAQALTTAGMSGVTAAGAAELALSLAVSAAPEEAVAAEPEPEVCGYWLLDGPQWGGLLPESLAPAVADGRLRLHPVSRLAPMVQIVVDLRRFEPADTELALLPQVDELLGLLLAALAGVPAELARQSGDVTVGRVAGRLRLIGVDAVASGWLKLSGAALYSFEDEILERTRARLVCLQWMTVELCGRMDAARGKRKRMQ